MIRSFFLISLMISGSAAVAQNTAQTAPAPAAKPVKEKKICRSVDSSVSRMTKRVCRTVQEWDDSRQEGVSQADLQRMGTK